MAPGNSFSSSVCILAPTIHVYFCLEVYDVRTTVVARRDRIEKERPPTRTLPQLHPGVCTSTGVSTRGRRTKTSIRGGQTSELCGWVVAEKKRERKRRGCGACGENSGQWGGGVGWPVTSRDIALLATCLLDFRSFASPQ